MTKKHQVLRQLDSVTDMAAKCINYFVYHPSKDFTRKRKLDAKTFIKTTLPMQGNCLNKKLADAFPKPSKRMTASAYEQQKSKVNPRLFKAILMSTGLIFVEICPQSISTGLDLAEKSPQSMSTGLIFGEKSPRSMSTGLDFVEFCPQSMSTGLELAEKSPQSMSTGLIFAEKSPQSMSTELDFVENCPQSVSTETG